MREMKTTEQALTEQEPTASIAAGQTAEQSRTEELTEEEKDMREWEARSEEANQKYYDTIKKFDLLESIQKVIKKHEDCISLINSRKMQGLGILGLYAKAQYIHSQLGTALYTVSRALKDIEELSEQIDRVCVLFRIYGQDAILMEKHNIIQDHLATERDIKDIIYRSGRYQGCDCRTDYGNGAIIFTITCYLSTDVARTFFPNNQYANEHTAHPRSENIDAGSSSEQSEPQKDIL